jgi:hypothetical protein
MKRFKCQEWTERLGYRCAAGDNEDLRICDKHPMDMVKGKTVKVPIEKDPGYEIVSIPPFKAPKSTSKNSFHAPATMVSNGLGMDREIVCHVKKISIEEAKLMQQTCSILAREGAETEKKV